MGGKLSCCVRKSNKIRHSDLVPIVNKNNKKTINLFNVEDMDFSESSTINDADLGNPSTFTSLDLLDDLFSINSTSTTPDEDNEQNLRSNSQHNVVESDEEVPSEVESTCDEESDESIINSSNSVESDDSTYEDSSSDYDHTDDSSSDDDAFESLRETWDNANVNPSHFSINDEDNHAEASNGAFFFDQPKYHFRVRFVKKKSYYIGKDGKMVVIGKPPIAPQRRPIPKRMSSCSNYCAPKNGVIFVKSAPQQHSDREISLLRSQECPF